MICSRIESALKNVVKKNIEYQRQLKELEVGDTPPPQSCPLIKWIGIQSRLTDGLSNFRTIDTLLQEVSAGLQVYYTSSSMFTEY